MEGTMEKIRGACNVPFLSIFDVFALIRAHSQSCLCQPKVADVAPKF
jgi:hypothetical protein